MKKKKKKWLNNEMVEEIEGYFLYQMLKDMYEKLGVDSFYYDLNEKE